MDDLKIKNTIEKVLGFMKIAFDGIEVSINEKTKSSRFLIKSKESPILIGANGANLLAINHLVKKIISKDDNSEKEEREEVKFFIDVNDYFLRIEEELKNRALMMAERAKSLRADVTLPPMSSYERMVVHSILQDMPGIKTESSGLGKDRYVVIKYKEELN